MQGGLRPRLRRRLGRAARRAHAAISAGTPGSSHSTRGRERRGIEHAARLLAGLAEVLPALVVDRHDRAGVEQLAQLDGVLCGHRVAQRAGDGEAHSAHVHDRSADADAPGDLAQPVIEHAVAGDPERAVLLALPAEREPDHLSDDRAAAGRAVPARRRGDLDRDPPGCLQRRRGPGRHPQRAGAEAPGAGDGGDRPAQRRQQRAPRRVEVVAVVVVAQQHRVDVSEVRGATAGPDSLRDIVPHPKK